MLGYDPSNDHQPVTWWRGHPVHAATLLVVLHVATMLATTLLLAGGRDGLVQLLGFSSELFFAGAIWQPLTYAFVNPPSIWFVIEMALLFMFGRELEKSLGRHSFLRLYVFLLILIPVVLGIIGFVSPTRYAGSGSLHFALFIAFATFYPNVGIFFGIAAKWIALALVAINSLQYMAANAWSYLIALWISIAAAYAYVRWTRGDLKLPSLHLFKRKPRFRVLPTPEPAPRSTKRPSAESASMDDIDPLLDKIAKSGLDSLTAAEKAKLERARAALLKNDPGSR